MTIIKTNSLTPVFVKKTRCAKDNLETPRLGVVIAHYNQTLDVEASDGTIYRCFARKNLGALVTGDRVIWNPITIHHSNTGVITAYEKRYSILQRPAHHKKTKTIAANINHIVVVDAIQPQPVPYFIDKYLVAAKHYGIPASILINKIL